MLSFIGSGLREDRTCRKRFGRTSWQFEIWLRVVKSSAQQEMDTCILVASNPREDRDDGGVVGCEWEAVKHWRHTSASNEARANRVIVLRGAEERAWNLKFVIIHKLRTNILSSP